MTITTQSSAPSIFDVDLPTIDYFHAKSAEEAHLIIRTARRQAPIAQGPCGPELLGYDVVRTALRDTKRFRVPTGFSLAAQGITSGPLWDRVTSYLMSLDGQQHHRLRRLVSKAFTPRATGRLDTVISEVITELVEGHTSTGHCDVVSDIAGPYPIPIICTLLGVPPKDWALFSDLSDQIFKALSWNAAAESANILAAWQELDTYVDSMIAQRRRALTDDLVSELIRTEADGDHLNTDELRMLVGTLLMTGTDTTRNQLAASVQALCENPEQWALVAERPELAASAVEETLRHSPVAFGALRTTVEEVALGGVIIPAGMLLIVNTAAANRDPAVYQDPDRLDITRAASAPMLTFGGGVHYCLGAHLARRELATALTVMTRRMHNPKRTAPVEWKPFTGLTGPVTLPIRFDTPAIRKRE